MERDELFKQAVARTREKDYKAARALLRNLLYKYPEDVNALLLFSVVAKSKETSIQALKEVLKINPDHDLAFERLAKLKHAPPSEALAHIAPQVSHSAVPLRRNVESQSRLVEREDDNIYSAIDNIRNTTRNSAPKLKAAPSNGKNSIPPILLVFLILIFLCVLVAGVEAALILLKII